DDGAGVAVEVAGARRQRAEEAVVLGGEQALAVEQAGECEGAEAHAGPAEGVAAAARGTGRGGGPVGGGGASWGCAAPAKGGVAGAPATGARPARTSGGSRGIHYSGGWPTGPPFPRRVKRPLLRRHRDIVKSAVKV